MVREELEKLRDEIYQHIDDGLIPTATAKMLRRAVITLTEVLLVLGQGEK